MKFNVLAVVFALAGLAGCAAPPSVPMTTEVFVDSAFKPPSFSIDPDAALAMSPEMKKFADAEMATAEFRKKDIRYSLIDALYTRGRLQLDYDSENTRTAAEAFEARRGNCMSLVLMTAAFARYLNMPVRYNSIYLEESWTRSNGIYVVAGHVNVTLERAPNIRSALVWGDSDLLTVDFLPPEQVRGQRGRVVGEPTILAMYMNNRAAEALTAGRVDDAYWWARAAILSDARWLSSYNTLAVLYRRKGMLSQAESVLRLVLEHEPLNVHALSNLSVVLNDLGRGEEAKVYANQLLQIQPVPPYKFFDEGVAAMKEGNYAAARQLFRREVARAAYVSEFHFWLALANYGLGDMPGARGEIAKAMESSATLKDRQLYGAKLAWLNQQRQH